MEVALKVFSWISIGIGFLAILGGVTEVPINGYGLLGGTLFFVEGLLALIYLKEME